MSLELLANAAVRMLVIGTVAWLALRVLRVRNPHVETLVWRMLLLASLALPLLLYWRLAPSFTTSWQLPVITAAGVRVAEAASGGVAARMAPMVAVATIYLGGVLLLLARLAAGLAGMWRVSRAAWNMPAPDDVRISARISSPATFGGVILLPPDAQAWPAEKLDAILMHERMHVRGRDAYWSWLAQLHAAVFWFSPFAWWLRRRLDTLAETISDDAVVAARHDPLAYAALLLEFSRHPNSRSVVMSVAESNVSRRIERLLARIPPAASLSRLARWTAFAALVPLVVFAASTTRAAPPVEDTFATASTSLGQPPRTVRLARAADPDRYYPVLARHESVSGYAVVEVDVDPLGTVVDARVKEVRPPDARYGFGEAALEVARNSGFQNTTQQVASMKFMVKFDSRKQAAADVRMTRAADPDNYYPAAAKEQRVSGYAVVEVDVDAQGHVVDARVVEVQPADPGYGFGDAAIQVARKSSFQNPNPQVASMRFKVKFDLKS